MTIPVVRQQKGPFVSHSLGNVLVSRRQSGLDHRRNRELTRTRCRLEPGRGGGRGGHPRWGLIVRGIES
eukprot:1187167-Prorocentrum_minimum.AAC.3